MRKSEVQIRREFGRAIPVVNVKHHGPMDARDPDRDVLAAQVVRDHGYPEIPGLPFAEWIAGISPDTAETFWRLTLADGWDRLGDLAREIWGRHARAVSYGRSDGWASVTFGEARRTPDVETWNAIDLGKWARFCRGARYIVADLEYQYLAALFLGPYSDAHAAWSETCTRAQAGEIFRGYASAACVG